MKPHNYSSCELPEHESEFLNIVCIDYQCKNRRLLCSYCQQDHQNCKIIPLNRFIKMFKDQIDTKNLEPLKQQNLELSLHLDAMEATLNESQKFFNNIFYQIKQAIHHAKQSLNQMTHSDSSLLNYCFILQQFESEPSHNNFTSLVSQIESFMPNPDSFSFTIKKIDPSQQLPLSDEAITNLKIDVSQFQSATKKFIKIFQQLHGTLQKSISSLFPQDLSELENDIQPFNNVQTIINEEQVLQLMQIQDDSMPKQLQQSTISNIPLKIVPPQNDIQQEKETILVFSEEKQFQLILGGQTFTKMVYMNQYMICGIVGSKFYMFDISSKDQNLQGIVTIQNDAEFTDLAYFNTYEQLGYIYLASKKGNIFKLITEGEKNMKIKEVLSRSHSIDKPGFLQIQVSPEEEQLYSIGEEMIAKVWCLQTMREVKRVQLQEPATAFHVDWKCLFIGGNNQIHIWNQTMGDITKLEGLEQRANKILTNESKLFVGLADKIKIYDKKEEGEFLLFKDVSFGQICMLQIIKSWPILVISYVDVKQVEQVGLYDFTETKPPQPLMEQSASSCCAIYEEQEIGNYLALVQKMGLCLIYKMEQEVNNDI
ncbi:unnamed protein product [Paramecium octaurelia]|uniref:Uncharacterized protein n=1 Tax=Paramecium octaurelia TaxID=43137 RepID=A0A8S1Y774_PAROT|nr:unnamed protein product [Paramecium octaurelia]